MRRLVSVLVLVVALSGAGTAHAVVKRWGGYGSRGYGLRRKPVEVPTSPAKGEIVKVDGGNAASYALTSDGALWAFGKNGEGELGNGTTTPSLTPVQVKFPAGTDIVAIGEARSSGFAIDSTGQGWVWGRYPKKTRSLKNEEAVPSLCLGQHSGDVLTPQPVPGLTGVRAVQGGSTHVAWLTDEGTVETCGANNHGQLGTGSAEPTSSLTPVVVPGLTGVQEISAGQADTCARTGFGEVYVWGSDQHGQVGNGTEEEAVFSPTRVPLPGPASEISCGGNLLTNGSAVALVNGVAYGWGDDESGQLGDGQTVNKTSPVVASETKSLKLTQIITSGAYSLGVNSEGNVYGWGSNEKLTIGAPGKVAMSLTPRLIDTGAVEVSGTAYDSVDR
jgi:alpha-tubulin suppressor-like RCC1 family protein